MLIFFIFGYMLIGLGVAILYEKYSNEGWYEDGDILGAIFFWPAFVVIFIVVIMVWIVRKAGGREL